MTEIAWSRRRIWPLLAAAIPALAVLLALGTWQVQRLHWKEDLLARIDAQLAAPPVEIAAVEAKVRAGEAVDYLPVRATGRFDHGQEQFFFATHGGQSGWYVYTPLLLENGRAVFVNRGFVPYDLKDPASRPGSQPEGQQAVEGLARDILVRKPSFIVPDNQPEKNVYYWKDIAAMTAAAGLAGEKVLPFFIDAGRPGDRAAAAQWPQPGVTIVDLPNNHLQYAVTWYGLAAALAAVLAAFVLRRHRGDPA